MPSVIATFSTWFRRNLSWSNSRQSWEERLGAILLIVGIVGVAWFGNGLPVVIQVMLWSALGVVASILLRRGWIKLFGPVLFYDMIRSARRGRYILLRMMYAMLLLFLLGAIYLTFYSERQRHHSSELDANDAAALAMVYFSTFMVVQLVAVLVLTPAYVAGAIADEKHRRTLEFLLATDLRNREIVLSKLGARLANLSILMLTGLPLLSFLQFLGGVDPNLVLAGFAATAATMAGLAGISIYNSTVSKKPRDAIAMTYLMVIGYYGLSFFLYFLTLFYPGFFGISIPILGNPITPHDLASWFYSGNLFLCLTELSSTMAGSGSLHTVLPAILSKYVLFQGIFAIGCPIWAIFRLRTIALHETGAKKTKRKRGILGFSRPAIGNEPMLWKEIYVEGGIHLHWLGRVVVFLLVLLSFSPLVMILSQHIPIEGLAIWGIVALPAIAGIFLVISTWRRSKVTGLKSILRLVGMLFLFAILLAPVGYLAMVQASLIPENYRNARYYNFYEPINMWARITGSTVACLMLMAVAIRASTSISSERDRDTFDSLLTTPLDSDQILISKWLGSIACVRWAWLWLGGIYLSATFLGAINPISLPLVLAAWFVYAGFIGLLGCWYSMVCKTSLRATVFTLLVGVLIGVGHWLPWMCCIPLMVMGPGSDPEGIKHVFFFQTGLTPPAVLGILPFYGREFESWSGRQAISEFAELFIFSLMGVGIYIFGTGMLWVVSSQRFREITLRSRDPFQPEMGMHPPPPNKPRRKRKPEDPLASSAVGEGITLLEEIWEQPSSHHSKPEEDEEV